MCYMAVLDSKNVRETSGITYFTDASTPKHIIEQIGN